MSEPLIYRSFGEGAIEISWQQKIDDKTRQDIYAFDKVIRQKELSEIIETVPAYCSLTIFLRSDVDHKHLIFKLKKYYRYHQNVEKNSDKKLWHIPVCYDLKYALDLPSLSLEKKLAVEDIIAKHYGVDYDVNFIGFLPGFAYLSGLHPQLHTPRLSQPRVRVEKGSVAIGGQQTGVYPSASPAGWHIIGRTPISFFDVNRTQPCFIRAMDKIRFYPISTNEFSEIAANGSCVIPQWSECYD